MRVLVGYDVPRRRAVIRAAGEVDAGVWTRLAEEARQADPSGRVSFDSIEITWSAALRCIGRLSGQQSRLGFRFEASDEEARRKLSEFVEQSRRIADLRSTAKLVITEEEVQSRLRGIGFVRDLMPYQVRDVTHLVSLPSGANFSVPGSGKTTVALAVYGLTAAHETRMLVVAPKNAFSAWDEVLSDCLRPGSDLDGAFTRLETSDLLEPYGIELAARYFLVSYDTAARNGDGLSALLTRAPFHLILDESHRIKAGEERRRGATLLGLSTLPVRKDILSGTPAPNQQRDLEPQIEFLFPGLPYSQQVVDAASPREVLRSLFVRTTKSELGLRAPCIQYPPVVMGEEQLLLYCLLKDAATRQIMEARQPGSSAQLRARRCVMYFLESSVNPKATVDALRLGTDFMETTPDVDAIFSAVLRAGDSNKILEACKRVRELVSNRKKVVVWTIFRRTLFRLEELLADLNPVLLYGSVPTGSATDPDTREGRIRRFLGRAGDRPDLESHVMIANPATAAEGISLHTACHDAIYLDRSYNAAHYLQSLDRINRIGLDPDQKTTITILESVAPAGVGSIDYSVRRRLSAKIRGMQTLLEDPDLGVLADFEDDADIPVDATIDLDDLADLLEELTTYRTPPTDDE
jgi:hypothetical protein